MALSLFVSIFPRVRDEVVISFATSALVTGVALIATGFTQGQRQEIAYYQQAIIVQMAGMGFGPAALAWLKRGHGRPDTVFFAFTILYTIVMACYLIYTVGEQSSDGPVINCFLDEVPAIYGKRAMKIINSCVVATSITVIFLSMITNRYINKKYYNGSNDYSERPPINKWLVLLMLSLVFAAETVLAASVEKTLTEYSQFVSDDTRAESQAWQFGQIIPFMMLLQPSMEALRAVLPKIQFKRNSPGAIQEEGGESTGDGSHIKIESKTDITTELKEVNITDSKEIIKELV
jgi:hypothetical protein